MFFILSKVFQYIFSPVLWIIILFLLAIILKKPKTKKVLFIVGFSMLIFFSQPFIFYEFMRAWEIDAKFKSELKESYDYGILLTGMITYHSKYERINFKSSSDRLWQTMELYKEGYLDKIFIVGGSGEVFNQEFKESQILKDYLIKLGIPEEDILIETNSRNTYENAVEAAKILKPKENNHSYLLITSAFHMRRSNTCFKKQGFECDTYVTDRYAGKRKFTADLLVPKAEILDNWNLLIHEVSGYVIYWITGKH